MDVFFCDREDRIVTHGFALRIRITITPRRLRANLASVGVLRYFHGLLQGKQVSWQDLIQRVLSHSHLSLHVVGEDSVGLVKSQADHRGRPSRTRGPCLVGLRRLLFRVVFFCFSMGYPFQCLRINDNVLATAIVFLRNLSSRLFLSFFRQRTLLLFRYFNFLGEEGQVSNVSQVKVDHQLFQRLS